MDVRWTDPNSKGLEQEEGEEVKVIGSSIGQGTISKTVNVSTPSSVVVENWFKDITEGLDRGTKVETRGCQLKLVSTVSLWHFWLQCSTVRNRVVKGSR